MQKKQQSVIKPLLIFSIAFILLLNPIIVQGAGDSNQSNQQQKIYFTQSSYFTLTDASLMESQQGNTLKFVLEVHNKDNVQINMIDYWVKLTTKSGAIYNVTSLDHSVNIVAPNTSKQMAFYTNLNQDIKLSDIYIQILEWSGMGYDHVLGQLSIPEQYYRETAVNDKKIFHIGDYPVSLGVVGISAKKVEEKLEHNVNVYIEYENIAQYGVTLPEYTYYLQTEENLYYPMEVKDGEAVRLNPKLKKELQLSTTLPENTSLANLKLVVVEKQQVKDKNIEFHIGTFQFPSAYTSIEDINIENLNEFISLEINDQTVEIRVKSVEETPQQIKLTLQVENEGDHKLTIPNYQFTLYNNNGIIYPIHPESSSIVIEPKQVSDVILTALKPSTVKHSDLFLDISKIDDTNEISESDTLIMPGQVQSSSPRSIMYTKEDVGAYFIQIKQLQRLPADTTDQISVLLTVKNTENITLPKLNMNGYFIFDGVKSKTEETKIINLDQSITIRPKEETSYVMYVNVPYTFEYDEVKFVLQEFDNESNVTAINEFEGTSLLRIPAIAKDKFYRTTVVGKRADIKARTLTTYEGDKTKLIYTELEIENEELRPTQLSDYHAYFETKEGYTFEASKSEVKNAVMPSGKVLMAFWSSVPRSYNTDGLNLVFGENVSDDKGDTAMINAVKIALPDEREERTDSFANLVMYPYTIMLDNLKPTIFMTLDGDGKVIDHKKELAFTYTLADPYPYQEIPEGHQLQIELVELGETHIAQYELNKDLIKGTRTIKIDIPKIEHDLSNSGIQLNVYDVFEGHKKLLASGSLNWIRQLRDN